MGWQRYHRDGLDLRRTTPLRRHGRRSTPSNSHSFPHTSQVSIYNIHGQRLPVEYSLGEACYHEKVAECVVYSGGIVALTCNNSIWAITDLNDVRPQRLADIEIDDRPQCMAVKLSPAHGVEVVLACDEYLIIVDAHQAVLHNPEIGIITMISISPSNQLMAVITDQNSLVALTSGEC